MAWPVVTNTLTPVPIRIKPSATIRKPNKKKKLYLASTYARTLHYMARAFVSFVACERLRCACVRILWSYSHGFNISQYQCGELNNIYYIHTHIDIYTQWSGTLMMCTNTKIRYVVGPRCRLHRNHGDISLPQPIDDRFGSFVQRAKENKIKITDIHNISPFDSIGVNMNCIHAAHTLTWSKKVSRDKTTPNNRITQKN